MRGFVTNKEANYTPPKLTLHGRKINYLYNAAGIKIHKKVTLSGNTTVTDYLNAFHYENQELKFFSHPEGYVAVTSGTFFNHVFNYTDHLGNTRLSYTENSFT